MDNYTILIDQYLNNELGAEERLEFENELAINAELKKELQVQQNIMAGLEIVALKQEFNRAIKNHLLKKNLGTWGGLSILIVVMGLSAFFLIGIEKQVLAAKSINVEVLETQLFEINTENDTIVETPGGIVFAIPANAFGSSKTVKLEIKEALSPDAIIRSGLSTTSNGELLQTAGMFYLAATDNGKEVPLTKEISASIPADEINPGMMLFDGKMDSNGMINWVDPTPIAKDLMTYDIKSLDFYPENYIPTIKAVDMKYKDKAFTDSFYYSFSGYGNVASIADELREPYFARIKLREDGGGQPYIRNVAEGKTLFETHCTSCHSIHQKLIGPALRDVHKRYNEEWTIAFIRNSTKLIKAGDPMARKLYQENGGSVMTSFENLSNAEIKNIIAYIEEESESIPLISSIVTTSKELDPSRIKAIWDENYNNTILATKEFEERLKYIHSVCKPQFLDFYVKNLDKPMYVIDSLCWVNGGGVKFKEFYERKNGGVKVTDDLQKKLSQYFDDKHKAYKEASEIAWERFYKDLEEKNIAAGRKKDEFIKEDLVRENKVFQDEFCLNLVDAYRQIGQEKQCPVPPPAKVYYKIGIVNTGWKNLDQYVMAATVNRESMEYTDPVNGRKAILTYEPASFTITEANQYDRVFVYLLPDSLSSFQRVKGQDGLFTEKLNALLNYDVMVLAYKGKQAYFFKENNIEAKSYTYSLKVIEEGALTKELQAYSFNKGTDMVREAEFRYFEQKEEIRQKQLKKEEDLRAQVARAVFPCSIIQEQIDSDTTVVLTPAP